MALKIFAGIVAMAMAITFLAAPVIKLKDTALTVVILLGIVLMLIDLWQSFREKDD